MTFGQEKTEVFPRLFPAIDQLQYVKSIQTGLPFISTKIFELANSWLCHKPLIRKLKRTSEYSFFCSVLRLTSPSVSKNRRLS